MAAMVDRQLSANAAPLDGNYPRAGGYRKARQFNGLSWCKTAASTSEQRQQCNHARDAQSRLLGL